MIHRIKIFLLAALLTVSLGAWGKETYTLIGQWTAMTEAHTSAGSMTFTPNGKVVLTPEGMNPAEGVYTLKGNWLTLDLSNAGLGKSAMFIEFADKNSVVFAYDNGLRQSFTRVVRKP